MTGKVVVVLVVVVVVVMVVVVVVVVGFYFHDVFFEAKEKLGWEQFAEWLHSIANLPPDEQLEKAYAFLGAEAGHEPLRPKKGSYEHITDAEINQFYREACKKLHPDRHAREDAATQAKFTAKMQQLQIYLELIKKNREETRKEKTFQEMGLSEKDIASALSMNPVETQEHAKSVPPEKLRAEIAYLAEFHVVQREKILEQEPLSLIICSLF